MRRKMPPAIISVAAGLVLLWHVGGSSAQPLLAVGSDAEITEEGLHRVHPSIMEAAWVKPDLDLSGYSRVLLMPTAVRFRDVRERSTDARTRAMTEEFPLPQDRKDWLTALWQAAVETRFRREESYEFYGGIEPNVLIVQAFLIDVVSRIPPIAPGSTYTIVSDPWSATVVLELRDAMTGEMLARTIDRRNATGLLEIGEVWYRTEDLITRWAEVVAGRLDQLSDLSQPRYERPSQAP